MKYTVNCYLRVDKPAGKSSRERDHGETALAEEFEPPQLKYLLSVGALTLIQPEPARKEAPAQ